MNLKNIIINQFLSKVYKAFLSVKTEQKPLFMIKTDKALVITPSAGDETLGMGGTIAKYSKNIRILCLTDKTCGVNPSSKKEAKALCEKELADAMNIAKVQQFEYLHSPNNEVIYAYEKLLKTDLSSYDYIFVPTPTDNVSNYKSLGVLMKRVLSEQKNLKNTLKIVLYEVWAPMPVTNNFVDISEQAETKNEMIKAYKSIPDGESVITSINALSQYRKYMTGKKQSEVFLSFDYKDFIKFITSIYG